MKYSLDDFLRFNKKITEYESIPKNNDDYVNALKICELRSGVSLPEELFDSMKSLDRKHFVVKLEELMGHAASVLGSKELLDEDIIEMAKTLPYNLKTSGTAIDINARHFTNDIGYDIFLYALLDLRKCDEVCEIASISGYLSALVGMNCKTVTSFSLLPELHGLVERNLKLANYNKNNLQVINDACPYSKTLCNNHFRKKFSKAYSNVPLTRTQYANAKKLIKDNGILLTPIKASKSETHLIYFNGEENVLAVMPGGLFTLEDIINYN